MIMEKSLRDKYIKQIIELIDDNENVNVKTAFYSDEYVIKTLEVLYQRWEENGRKSIPLDYANDDELIQLLKKAKYYYANPNPSFVFNLDKKKERKENTVKNKFIKIFKKLFIGNV